MPKPRSGGCAATWRRCSASSARLGWNEQIGNHNSVMLPQRSPGRPPLFLINPRGYLFQELTASSLIVCDLDGHVLRGKGELRKVAFHIHARIHLKKPNATCIVHVHPQYLTALALLEDPEFRAVAPQQPVAQRPRGVSTPGRPRRWTTTRKATASPS